MLCVDMVTRHLVPCMFSSTQLTVLQGGSRVPVLFLETESEERFLNHTMCIVCSICTDVFFNSQQAFNNVDRLYFGHVTQVTRIQGWVRFYSWWSAVTKDQQHVFWSSSWSTLLKKNLVVWFVIIAVIIHVLNMYLHLYNICMNAVVANCLFYNVCCISML